MRKIVILLLIAAFAAGNAFAHGGKSHRLLGTVKELQKEHLVVKTTDGHEETVRLTEATRFEKDKKPTTRSALAGGMRVSIELTEDDTTAVKVKIGAAVK